MNTSINPCTYCTPEQIARARAYPDQAGLVDTGRETLLLCQCCDCESRVAIVIAAVGGGQ